MPILYNKNLTDTIWPIFELVVDQNYQKCQNEEGISKVVSFHTEVTNQISWGHV